MYVLPLVHGSRAGRGRIEQDHHRRDEQLSRLEPSPRRRLSRGAKDGERDYQHVPEPVSAKVGSTLTPGSKGPTVLERVCLLACRADPSDVRRDRIDHHGRQNLPRLGPSDQGD
jgi:hypothetical protein